LWAEWNGRYRDVVRGYWKGDDGQLAEFGYRITGSSDLYQRDGRKPSASINFVTAHDGFTLQDLVSYNEKHNLANLENNRDGNNDNHSWNGGVEGSTIDPATIELRQRQRRNFLLTLLFSQGVPMICGGDEIGRTQLGNNNAYAQDNEISWTNWSMDEEKRALLEFTRRLIQIRLEHPNLHRRRFFQDRRIDPDAPDFQINGAHEHDILWLRPNGAEMSAEEWNSGWIRCIGLYLNGKTLRDVNAFAEPINDDTFLILFNPSHLPIPFTPPTPRAGHQWELMIDTRNNELVDPVRLPPDDRPYDLAGRCAALFREVALPVEEPEEESPPPPT